MPVARRPGWLSVVVLAGVLAAAVLPAQAQSSRDTQR
jgi:hypothetical protein